MNVVKDYKGGERECRDQPCVCDCVQAGLNQNNLQKGCKSKHGSSRHLQTQKSELERCSLHSTRIEVASATLWDRMFMH